MAGSLQLTREQLAIITGNDPRAIRAFEAFFATLNNLGSHAPTHEPGGTDPLTVDAAPATGSLRTLGAGAAQACAGNDARLSDDRDPTAHAAEHGAGGADELVVAALGGFPGGVADYLREDGTWQTPPSGGWVPVDDPGTEWLASKTAGWTANDFTSGYLEVDFSAVVPAGTKAVVVVASLQTAGNYVYWKKTGDANISDTPNTAPRELSHLLFMSQGTYQVTLWLPADYKVRFTVVDVNSDLYISHPLACLP